MEALSQRLDSIQEELLSLYEKESTSLESQLQHWNLLRKEQVLLHFCKKHGIRQLGYTPVPSLLTSQECAKQAIEMVLYIESLLRSPYSDEPWTLQDTSRERFESPPQKTFKKNPASVEVYYDGDRGNNNEYTLWGYIYYWDADGEWVKTESGVDYRGIYYVDSEGNYVYYVDFSTDAGRFAANGHYDVVFQNMRLSSSVTSSPQPLVSAPEDTVPEEAPDSAVPAAQKKTGPKTTRTLGRRRSRSPGVQRRPAKQRKQAAPDEADSATGDIRPPAPEDVGRRTTTVGRTPPGRNRRLRELITEASDPPVICLKGGHNQLKCLRYRLKSKHSSLFDCISTTWSWVDTTSTCRLGSGRMLIKFADSEQRDKFLSRVPLPSTTQVFLGNFYGL
uniref:Regulatory protein E2 n=1 Tax=Kappapapillomavirus 2 TaxID=10623 RepID=F6LNN4_9PAPI|nr:E2 [Kappapapillomavirus 2]